MGCRLLSSLHYCGLIVTHQGWLILEFQLLYIHYSTRLVWAMKSAFTYVVTPSVDYYLITLLWKLEWSRVPWTMTSTHWIPKRKEKTGPNTRRLFAHVIWERNVGKHGLGWRSSLTSKLAHRVLRSNAPIPKERERELKQVSGARFDDGALSCPLEVSLGRSWSARHP